MEPEIIIQGVSMGHPVEVGIPLMTEVAPFLWVGGAAGTVLPEKIQHVVSLIGDGGYEIRHPVSSMLLVHWEDSTTQSLDQADAIASWAYSCTGDVLVHCIAGLNRSALIAARVMMLSGLTADSAIREIREKRSEFCLHNPHFEGWLRGVEIPPGEEGREHQAEQVPAPAPGHRQARAAGGGGPEPAARAHRDVDECGAVRRDP